MKRMRALFALAGVAAIAAVGWLLFRPRPSEIRVTPRAGDDTLVVNQHQVTLVRAAVIDQYGRPLSDGRQAQYRWVGGDSLEIKPDGELRCDRDRDAMILATFDRLAKRLLYAAGRWYRSKR